MAKVDATRSYGADVEMGGASFEDAVAAARRHVESTGATFVHAFEDALVIAGQGTIGLEIAEQVAGSGHGGRAGRRRRARGRDRDRARSRAGRARG